MELILKLAISAALALALAGDAAAQIAQVGNCAIWSQKRGTFRSKPHDGNQAGFNEAKAWVGTNGTIWIYPGCDGQITFGTLSDSVLVMQYESGSWRIAGARATATVPRLGPASSAGSGGALRIVDGVTFLQTGAGIQAAINDLPATGGLVLLPAATFTNVAVTLKEGIDLVGTGDPMKDAAGTVLNGVSGSDVITLQAAIAGAGPTTRYGFTMKNLLISGGRNGIASYTWSDRVRIDNVRALSQESSGVYIEGGAQNWFLTRFRAAGAKYGFRKANVGWQCSCPDTAAQAGCLVNYIDDLTIDNATLSGSINGFRFEGCRVSVNTKLVNVKLESTGQHGFYLDGPASPFLIMNGSAENIGTTGDNKHTTGSITSGTAVLTVADTTGFVAADTITVAHAGVNGLDLKTTMLSKTGMDITLAGNASTTVTSQPVTNAIYDVYHINNAIPGGKSEWTWLGGSLTGEATIRYSMNLTGISGAVSFITTSVPGVYPIYDPTGLASTIGGEPQIRGQNTNPYFAYRVTRFPPTISTSGEEFTHTNIPSPIGKNLDLILRDSADNGTGTYGSLNVRNNNGNKAIMLTLTPDPAAANTGSLSLEGKVVFSDSLRTNKGLYVGGRFMSKWDGAAATLNFGVPAAVPGSVDLTITIAGAALGDRVFVAAPITIGANYILTGFVSAASTVTVRWTQIAGAAADPDGAGGTYEATLVKN